MSAEHRNKVIALVGFTDALYEAIQKCNFGEFDFVRFSNGLRLVNAWLAHEVNIAAIISNSEIMAPSGLELVEILKKRDLHQLPFFLIVKQVNANLREVALTAGITDVFVMPLKNDRIEKRVVFSINNWNELSGKSQTNTLQIKKIELSKRVFDLFFAGSALLALSPVFLIVYLLIKLESRGPAFYYSLRVGTGYKVFKFYKFRSMYVDADKRLKDLKHLNQYNEESNNKEELASPGVLCNECLSSGKCQYAIYADNVEWCEKDFMYSRKASAGSAFIKIKDDPRITKVGNFIRNSSIDELPQLWNVIIGNMSIVGNRPLPLYEAEKLTTDKYVLRFSAPAGITGLWQVEKRGKSEMSEEERLMLDNVYAQNHSFRNDLKLIMKTIPALLQKTSV